MGPSINLNVVPVSADIPKAELESGHIDLALGPFSHVPPGLHEQALFQERFVSFVRAGHPEVGKQLSLKQFTLLPHVLLSTRGATPGRVDEALAKHGLRRRVALWVPHFLVIPLVVAQTNLIATLSERVVRYFAKLLRLRVLTPPVKLSSYTVSQVWHERMHHDPAHQWLRRVLGELGKVV